MLNKQELSFKKYCKDLEKLDVIFRTPCDEEIREIIKEEKDAPK